MTPTNTPANRKTTRVIALTAALLTAVALTGCGSNGDQGETADLPAVTTPTAESGLHGTLVEPPLQVAPVTLRDTHGNPVRLDRLPDGKATAIFFGFTNCPDLCPTTMADLVAARQSLPLDVAARVVLYFVTVDPRRDTRPVLDAWLDRLDPEIVGLRGPTNTVNEAERSLYAVESGATAPDDSKGSAGRSHHTRDETLSEPHGRPREKYEVNHSGSVYVFGPRGETVLYTGGYTAEHYAADLARLLREPS